jgi:hypothetical protein
MIRSSWDWPGDSGIPRAEAIDDTTRSADDTSSSGTITTPSNLPIRPEPTSSANRVLPIPPAPTGVTRRASPPVSRSWTSDFSRSRPMNRDAGLGSGRPSTSSGRPAFGGASSTSNRSLSSTARSSAISVPSSSLVAKLR